MTEQTANSNIQDDLEPIREKILLEAVQHAPFDGWTGSLIGIAAKQAGVSELDANLAFPHGSLDLVEYFSRWADARMLERLDAMNIAEMKIRERVTMGVRARLEVVEPHKEAVRRAVTYQTNPLNAPSGAKLVAETVDKIWRAAGDTSNDFNFYTKRTLLAGVYTSTLLFWLGDNSDGHQDTWAFLDRRINDVMQIQKVKGKVEGLHDKLPNPAKILGGLRYGLRPGSRRGSR